MGYVTYQAVVTATGINEADIRCLRRHTGQELQERRQGRGGVLRFELESLLTWLRRILPRVDPRAERDLRAAAAAQEVVQ